MFCQTLCAVLVVCCSAFVGEGIALTLYAQRLVMTAIYVIYHLDLYVASMVTSVDGIRAVVLALRTLLMISVLPIHVSNTTPCGCLWR